MEGLLSQRHTSKCQDRVRLSFHIGFFCLFLCLFFRVYCCVELPCDCTLVISLGVMEDLLYQRHASRQCNYKGTRFSYPSIHINIGSVDIGSARSVWFRIHINLGCVKIFHPIFHHQDTTLHRSQMSGCPDVSKIHWGTYQSQQCMVSLTLFFVNLVFVCIWRSFLPLFNVNLSMSASIILSCVTLPTP